MKAAVIEEEGLHIFWTTWGISMKFSRKLGLMIKLKVTKNQRFTLSLEDTFLEKPQREVSLLRDKSFHDGVFYIIGISVKKE